VFSIVYLHGFASGPHSQKARMFADYFAAKGVPFAAPDLNAPAFRSLSLTRIIEAAEETSRGAAQVCVIGSSLGGYAAAFWAAQREAEGRPLRAGMLMAPAFGAERLWRARVGPEALEGWKKSGELALRGRDGRWLYGPDYPVLDYGFYEDLERWAATPLKLSTPLIVFHGERDDVVPASHSLEFASGRSHVTLELFAEGLHGLEREVPIMADKAWKLFQRA
jgi:uncharacterized protein